MSGSGRHVVYKDMEIGAWPNGLTLDHQERRIVWTDARYGKIKCKLRITFWCNLQEALILSLAVLHKCSRLFFRLGVILRHTIKQP